MLGFCIAGIHNGLTYKRKLCFYVHFKQMFASSLVSAKKHTRGQPSAESKLTPLPSKLVKV